MTEQKISIAQLRPTQMTLGLDEVASRAAKIAAMGPAVKSFVNLPIHDHYSNLLDLYDAAADNYDPIWPLLRHARAT